MFSPYPPYESWWYVIEATKVNDEIVELFRNRGMFEWKGSELGNACDVLFCLSSQSLANVLFRQRMGTTRITRTECWESSLVQVL